MDFVKTITVGRAVDKLKSSRELAEHDLDSTKARITAAGNAAIEPLLRSLSHADARRPALEILDALLDNETLGQYLEALASPNPAIVSGITHVVAKNRRFDASRLLSGLVDPRISKAALETVLQEHVQEIPPRSILTMIGGVDKTARVILFRLLEQVTDLALVPDLLSFLREEDWWLRLQAAKVLARLHCQTAAEGLMRLLEDSSNRVRLEAVQALRRQRATIAIPQLVRRLRDPDLQVQSAAIDALVDLGDATTVPHLLEVLTDESEHARRGAVEVLNEVASTEAIQDLIRALHDEDWWVRVRAADALGSLGGERVVEAVIGLLGEKDEFLRRYAVEVLNTVPSEKAVEPLLRALEDSDWWVRERSIDALGIIRDVRAVEPLIILMQSDLQAQALCAKALGAIGDVRALEPLSALVNSEREEVKREATAAVAALSNAGHKKDTRAFEARLSPQGRLEPRRNTPVPPVSVAVSPPPSPGAPKPSKVEVGAHVLHTVNFANLPGDTLILDRYRVVRRIGAGGFGAVYLVSDAAIQEEVILKILNPQLSADTNELGRFVQELKLTRKISNKNVIRIFDLLDLSGVHAVSMEYFPSRDLRQILDAEKTVSPRRMLEMVVQICNGLAAAHDEGVIHRDIKPANILVGDGDSIKIVDFGLAWTQQRVGSRLTRSSLLIGTPEYMAPEFISAENVDHRVDIYSLGIVMYEMLTGSRPYASENVVKILFQHLEGEARPLIEVIPEIRPGIDKIVRSAMARDPGDRPQDIRELRAMVEAELTAMRAMESESDG